MENEELSEGPYYEASFSMAGNSKVCMVDIAPYYRIRGKSLFPDGTATIEADSEEEEGQGSPMNKGLRGLVSRRESPDPEAPSETALKAMQQQVEKKKRHEERV